MYERLLKFFNGWRDITRAMEFALIDNLAATAPWLAPVIPAFLAWRNMTTVLEFPNWVAFTGAAVVETLGLATVHTVFSLWDYNAQRRQTDQRAPVAVAILAAGMYITIVLVVNVLLDRRTTTEMIAQALLSLLSVVAAVTLAIRANHSRRLADIREQREARRQERLERKEPGKMRKVAAVKQPGNLPEDTGHAAQNIDWRTLPLEDRETVANLTTAQIAERYGVSDRTARNWRANAAAGRNGGGVTGPGPAQADDWVKIAGR